jgi:N-acetylglutamate synthase-like GNAT family acetyltransferase
MAAALSVLLTNSKHFCITEGLFSNPDLTPRVRREALRSLLLYVEEFAKALEYKGLFCIPISKSMGRHFEKQGFKMIKENVATMHKRIGG